MRVSHGHPCWRAYLSNAVWPPTAANSHSEPVSTTLNSPASFTARQHAPAASAKNPRERWSSLGSRTSRRTSGGRDPKKGPSGCGSGHAREGKGFLAGPSEGDAEEMKRGFVDLSGAGGSEVGGLPRRRCFSEPPTESDRTSLLDCLSNSGLFSIVHPSSIGRCREFMSFRWRSAPGRRLSRARLRTLATPSAPRARASTVRGVWTLSSARASDDRPPVGRRLARAVRVRLYLLFVLRDPWERACPPRRRPTSWAPP